ncbi:MAG: hypothetical protein MUP92_02705 [Actinobacteria bacterium]|nr:hypothetical protein [Actinomycetota bacterium]
MSAPPPRIWKATALALAGVAFLAALWGGLVRIGWAWPTLRPAAVVDHGALMVLGFLGTLVSLERAAALGRRWMYAAPFLTAAGAIWALAGGPIAVAQSLMLAGGCVLLAIYFVLLQADPQTHILIMAVGALMWPVGAAWWLSGEAFPHVLPWFAGFVVLTIAGERLELSRIMRRSQLQMSFFHLGVAAVFVGALLASKDIGWRIAGAGMAVLGIWLLLGDIARRRISAEGLPRFMALTLLGGYAWLVVSGAFWIAYQASPPLGGYDAMLHSLFVGFTFSMIFAHAPIIVPSLLGTAIPYRPALFVGPALLSASLVLRIVGDLSENLVMSRWGALLNATSFILFAAILTWSARTTRGGFTA